jgi:hypothetical protein
MRSRILARDCAVRMSDGSFQIPLGADKFAAVDAADLELIGAFHWHAQESRRGLWYAICQKGTRARRRTLRMHCLIHRAGLGKQVDHEDGNGLNNRRRNLRSATDGQNRHNRRRTRARSGFCGVHRSGDSSVPWVATINVKGKPIYLGRFATPDKAARAYDRAAKLHYGEFAKLNFGEVSP